MSRPSVSRAPVRTRTVLLVIAVVIAGWTLLGLLVADSVVGQMSEPFVTVPSSTVVPAPGVDPAGVRGSPGWGVPPW